jgi:hypothetical protein
MARIFNSIRQRLLKENRLTRYLVYAIGEILLVVIGILIALQINDSSAQRKLERTNVRLMERMQDELTINIDRLHYLDTMYAFQKMRLGWTPMLGRIDTAIGYITEGLDEERLVWMLNTGLFHDGNMYNMSTAVYREMLSSGRFYSLGPHSLMERIQKYYQLLEREERYAIDWNDRGNSAWKECKYGFNDLLDDYRMYGRAALKDHPWYQDRRSREFIDLKSALLISKRCTERNRRHAYTMIQHSDTLMQALQHEILSHP